MQLLFSGLKPGQPTWDIEMDVMKLAGESLFLGS
jgi:hypothetical protein